VTLALGGHHHSVLAFRGLRIAVRSNIAAPLLWLEEFLSPHLIAETDGSPQHEVSLSIDPQRHARLRAEPRTGGERPIDCFLADGRFERLALWRDAPDGRLLHDASAQPRSTPKTGQ
jgi:hypothetical protein